MVRPPLVLAAEVPPPVYDCVPLLWKLKLPFVPVELYRAVGRLKLPAP